MQIGGEAIGYTRERVEPTIPKKGNNSKIAQQHHDVPLIEEQEWREESLFHRIQKE
jgi:hypothetical protein